MKVVPIKPGVEKDPEPDAFLIAQLEELLEAAKAGAIHDMFCVYVDVEGLPGRFHVFNAYLAELALQARRGLAQLEADDD